MHTVLENDANIEHMNELRDVLKKHNIPCIEQYNTEKDGRKRLYMHYLLPNGDKILLVSTRDEPRGQKEEEWIEVYGGLSTFVEEFNHQLEKRLRKPA